MSEDSKWYAEGNTADLLAAKDAENERLRSELANIRTDGVALVVAINAEIRELLATKDREIEHHRAEIARLDVELAKERRASDDASQRADDMEEQLRSVLEQAQRENGSLLAEVARMKPVFEVANEFVQAYVLGDGDVTARTGVFLDYLVHTVDLALAAEASKGST